MERSLERARVWKVEELAAKGLAAVGDFTQRISDDVTSIRRDVEEVSSK